jgi:hypothetical protein
MKRCVLCSRKRSAGRWGVTSNQYIKQRRWLEGGGTYNVSRSPSGAIGSGDCPQNTPELAQTRSRSEAARMVPLQTAVAIASQRLVSSIPRSDHASRHSRTTPRRLRFGASVNESLRSIFKFDRTRCLRDSRRYQRLRPAIRQRDPSPTCCWRVSLKPGAF